MPVVRIRKMRVSVSNRCMPVRMRMAHTGFNRGFVRMVMMLVAETMRMFVAVLQRLVDMGMLVTFRQMQPDTAGHQCARHKQGQRDGFTEERNRQDRAHKRRDRKISACAGSPEVAQPEDKQCQAGTVARETQKRCRQHDG